MLTKLGRIIEKRPWTVVLIIVVITIGFGTLLPSLEMQTSMEHFLPDHEVVQAQQRISDYFGPGYEVLMIYVEKDKAPSVLDPDALREQQYVAKKLDKFDETAGTIGVAGFINTVCWVEYGKSVFNCTNEQIITAYQDLMSEPNYSEIKILNVDDPNEEIDYNPRPRISNGKPIDSIDIKNCYIQEKNETLCFSIEVHDLSHYASDLIPPDRKLNVLEWYIDFENLIIPDEMLDIDYKIAAHIEPTNPLWEIGKGPVKNLREILQNIRNRELFKSFKKEAFLWITPPGQEMSFPIPLETGNITFNIPEDRIVIEVGKEELGQYGISPKWGDMQLPSRLGNFQAGTRYFQISNLKLPWLRIYFNGSFLEKRIEKIQNRPILSAISTRIMSRFGDFSWDDLDELYAQFENGDFEIDKLSLKDMSNGWVVADETQMTDSEDVTLFIKPFFIEDMKNSVLIFLPEDFDENIGASATLMMVQINGSLSSDELVELSNEISDRIKSLDKEQPYVSMRTTGANLIEYEINEVAMEANSIIIPIIFIVISLILLFSFRRLSYVFLPLLGLSLAIVWLFGTMVLLGMDFIIIEVALIPMLMGLGVDYSVHLFHNYRVEIGKGKKPGPAIISSISDIGMALFLATITTFIAFLSFLSATMIPLRDFGVLCALGIAYVFIITITFQAALRFILDRRKKALGKLKTKKDPNGKMMRKTARVICKHHVIILLITVAATVFMIGGALQVQTGFQMEDFLPAENPSVIVMNEISEVFPFSSQDQEYVLIEGDVASRNTLIGVSKTLENMQDDDFVLRTINGDLKTVTILSLIDKVVERNSSIAEEFHLDQNSIPQTDGDVKRLFDYLYDSDFYSYETKEVLHRDGSKYDATLISIYTSTFGSNSEDVNDVMKVLYNELNDDMADYGGASGLVTGDNSMMYVIMNSMTESQILSTGICILLAAIVLVLAYRKPLLGLITMIPVSVSTIWIVGTMHFIGYSLNVMTIMITTLTIGLGITYAIHAVERFRLVADRTGDVIGAVSETIGHTGGALLIAAITTVAGFGMLILTPVPIEQQFGLITALTILYAFLTSIFILPPVLMFWGKWKKKKKGYIISPGPPKNDEKND